MAEISFPNVADLRLYAGVATTAFLIAHTVFGDEGGGTFAVKPGDTTTPDNDSSVIVDSTGRRWWRVDAVTAFARLAEAQEGTSTAVAMNPARTFDSIRVVTTHVSIREKRFAGGAPLNGIDDDGPAIQAALDHFKPYGQYNGSGIAISLGGRGEPRVDSTSIDLTDCHGIELFGDGRGVTQLKGSGNRPVVTWRNATALPLTNVGLRDFTIVGPGWDQALADGILGGANNNCRIDLRIWSCRRGIALANSWQTTLKDIRIDGGGGLACHDGLVLLDGEKDVLENCVLVLGGEIANTKRFGFRGESVTGSKVFGLEVVGCENTGVYFGESPQGKDLKWFTWVGGLIDTCPTLLTVRAGASSVHELLHFSGFWIGYANGNPAGVGVEFNGMNDCVFNADLIANCVYAMNIQNCSRMNVGARLIKDYDRLLGGGAAIIVNDTTDSTFDLGPVRKAASSPSTTAIVEQGTTARNVYTGVNADGLIYTLPGNGSTVGNGRHLLSGASQMIAPQLPIHAIADLPTASPYWAGKLIAVSDEVGGYTLAFCDGGNWRRVQDRNIVS